MTGANTARFEAGAGVMGITETNLCRQARLQRRESFA